MNSSITYSQYHLKSRKYQAASMYDWRLRMVRYAQEHSIKAAAREFEVSRNTVRRWVRRFESGEGLEDKKRGTTNHPMKMKFGYRCHLESLVQTKVQNHNKIIGTQVQKQLQTEVGGKYSLPTIIKTLKQIGAWKTKKPKARPKRDLREVTDRMKFGECIQIDIKYLTDIPAMRFSQKCLDVPKYQITARDRATGALWYAFANEKSSMVTTLFAEYLLEHLRNHDGDLAKGITVQTDNGAEFTVRHLSKTRTSGFEQALIQAGVEYLRIPPGQCTWNSSVESSHRLIEDEFYSQVMNPKLNEFLKEAEEYQIDFNYRRFNTYRKGTPLELLRQRNTNVDSDILRLKPIIMEQRLTRPTLERWRAWHSEEMIA